MLQLPSQRRRGRGLGDGSRPPARPTSSARRAAPLALALSQAFACAEEARERASAALPTAQERSTATGGVAGRIFWGGAEDDVASADAAGGAEDDVASADAAGGAQGCAAEPALIPGEGLEGAVVWLEMEGAPPSWWDRGALPVSDCGLAAPIQLVRAGDPVVLEADGLTAPRRFQIEGRAFSLEPGGRVAIDGLAPGPVALEGELRGALVLAEHGGYTLTDVDGGFELPEIPPGRHQIHFWHPVAGEMDFSLSVEAGRRSQIELHWP